MNDARFRTDSGHLVPAVTATEMRAVDRIAVEEYAIGIRQMMEHAGRALAGVVRTVADGPVLVLAGNGGNGGGGLCAARHLANRDTAVRVVLDRPLAALEGPAGRHARTLDRMGVRIDTGTGHIEDTPVDCVIDALVGYGLEGPLRGPAKNLVESVADRTSKTVSLDVPSGIDATTGESHGVAVAPDHVLTLALPKTGLAGRDWRVTLADIGLPAGVFAAAGVEYDSPFGDAYTVPITALDRS